MSMEKMETDKKRWLPKGLERGEQEEKETIATVSEGVCFDTYSAGHIWNFFMIKTNYYLE